MLGDDLRLTLAIWLPSILGATFVLLFGACVGSFLNVLVWRLPTGQSVVSPPSRCPICGHRLSWRENLPILGWILLRGRCKACRSPISAQYPIIELVVALLFAATFLAFYAPLDRMPTDAFHDAASPWWHLQGFSRTWPAFTLVVLTMAGLVAMLLVDARTMLIPIDIPITTTSIALVGWLVQGFLPEARSVADFVPIPVATWKVVLACAGLFAGLGVSRWLIATGRLTPSFADWAEYERPAGAGDGGAAGTEAHVEYPHARREMMRELAFLLPGLVGAVVGWFAAGSLGLGGSASADGPLSLLGGALVGCVVGGGAIWAIRILGTLGFGREAMGLGDVYLQAAVGAALGWRVALLSVFVAVFLSLAWAILMKLLGRFGRFFGYREIPFGPFLAVGAILFIVARGPVAWTFDLFGQGILRLSEVVGLVPEDEFGDEQADRANRGRSPTGRLAQPRDER